MSRIEELLRKASRVNEKWFQKNEAMDIDSFITFYRSVLKDIDSHITYELEMKRKQNVPRESIVEFRSSDYLKKLHLWYSSHKYYRFGFDDQVKQLITAMLIEDSSGYENLPRKTLSQLVLGQMANISANCRLPLPNLIKEFYLYLKESSQFETEERQTRAHRIFDEMMALSDHRDSTEQVNTEEKKIHAMEGILQAAGIIDAKTARKVVRRGSILVFSLKLMVNIALVLIAFQLAIPLLLSVINLTGYSSEIVGMGGAFVAVALMALLTFLTTLRFAVFRTKVVVVRRSLIRLRRALVISDTMYRKAILEEYSPKLGN